MKLLHSTLHLTLWVFFVIGVPALFISSALPVQAEVGFSLGAFLRQVGPALLGLLLAAVLVTWCATGVRGLRHAWGWVRGHREEATAAVASRALSTASRTILFLGIVAPLFMLVTMGAYLARLEQDPSYMPAGMGRGFVGVMHAPLYALLLGRVVFGSLATRAASLAGLPADRSLRGWSGFAVPLLIVFIVSLLLLITIYPMP